MSIKKQAGLLLVYMQVQQMKIAADAVRLVLLDREDDTKPKTALGNTIYSVYHITT